jgi:CheY-like chemotaxis protein
MPFKILLADKSITIQKVVEMLFSGKEYSVTAVSDGESALSEAARIVPDVVLADVDLPRLDGYSLSARLKQDPRLAQAPVILMLSRDDIYDEAKGRQAGIVDHLAKPFESQELIGKVKKALTEAPSTLGEPAAAASRPAARPVPPSPPKPKPAVPSDIFDIIQEAPSRAEVKRAPAAPAPADEAVYEVEPEVEIEEPLEREVGRVLPVGERAREEMRKNLGLGGQPAPSEGSELEAFGAIPVSEKPVFTPPPRRESVPPRASASAAPSMQPPAVSEEMLRAVAEETIARIAREVLERVAWEVIPRLAEQMIREEIEKLKAETM